MRNVSPRYPVPFPQSYRPTFPHYYDAGSTFYQDLANALVTVGKRKGLEVREISAVAFEGGVRGKSVRDLLSSASQYADLDGTWILLYSVGSGVTEQTTEYGYYFNKVYTTTYEGLTAAIYPLFVDNSKRTPPVSLPPKSISIKRQQGEHMEDVEDRILQELINLFEGSVA